LRGIGCEFLCQRRVLGCYRRHDGWLNAVLCSCCCCA
jgi:hypothetical protein